MPVNVFAGELPVNSLAELSVFSEHPTSERSKESSQDRCRPARSTGGRPDAVWFQWRFHSCHLYFFSILTGKMDLFVDIVNTSVVVST